ncbi:c-type cytochrome [Litoribrevibacter euphylliae]|uniref:C-type cytochrome n=1 Tax=Litoribrevibacter euphylliae TaxID=1834034 RepID=A0ABV7HGF6_9GAMM
MEKTAIRLQRRTVGRLGLVCLTTLVLTACGNPELELGEQIYTGTCKACHAGGINGAPILGNNKMWSKRAPQGIPTLVEHASNGYGLMPAKGGNTSLNEQEITAAVKFMLSQLEN